MPVARVWSGSVGDSDTTSTGGWSTRSTPCWSELKVLYRTLAARWHQMVLTMLTDSRPVHHWLDEFSDGALV